MSTSNAHRHPAARAAGISGVVSAVLLLSAPALPLPEQASLALWLIGFLLLLPFLAGIATLARESGGRAAWLSPAIPAAGAVLVSVHLTTMGIEHAANHTSKSSPAHEALHDIGAALFTLGMLPLGLAMVACGTVGLVGHALPKWLAWAGVAVGLTSLVNGTMLGSESAWGFLTSILWVLACGIRITLRGLKTSAAPQMAAA